MVEFTQFLRPDRRREQISIEMDYATEAKANEIVNAGYRFEAEVLMTDVVSFTIAGYHPDLEEDSDLAIKLVPNGPKVPETVKALIDGFVIP